MFFAPIITLDLVTAARRIRYFIVRVVYALIQKLEPALLTMAHEGTNAYSEAFDLLHRQEAEAPNAMWQADHSELVNRVLKQGHFRGLGGGQEELPGEVRAGCGAAFASCSPGAITWHPALRRYDARDRICLSTSRSSRRPRPDRAGPLPTARHRGIRPTTRSRCSSPARCYSAGYGRR